MLLVQKMALKRERGPDSNPHSRAGRHLAAAAAERRQQANITHCVRACLCVWAFCVPAPVGHEQIVCSLGLARWAELHKGRARTRVIYLICLCRSWLLPVRLISRRRLAFVRPRTSSNIPPVQRSLFCTSSSISCFGPPPQGQGRTRDPFEHSSLIACVHLSCVCACTRWPFLVARSPTVGSGSTHARAQNQHSSRRFAESILDERRASIRTNK